MQFLSVYLHIPFCRKRCSYCAFNIYTDKFALVDAYVRALCDEFRWLGQGEVVHTLYFGGGTPSLLSIHQLERILAALHSVYTILPQGEITLEANPGTIDQPYLESLRQIGINRLSLGMQSAISAELALFERDHTLAETHQTMQMAQAAGFDNISLDLIYGVPGQTLADWQCSLDDAIALQPTHFSLYALQLESGTRMTRMVKYGQLAPPDDDLAADMYDLATENLAAAGFRQYEISSWAKPGYASLHNMQYWRNLPYIGAGAGAHGFVKGFRTVNVMRPEKYIERLAGQTQALDYPRTAATQSLEPISRSEEMFETVMLGLRMLEEGLSRQVFQARFNVSLDEVYGDTINRLTDQGWLYERDNTLYLTPQTRLIANRVFTAFLPEET